MSKTESHAGLVRESGAELRQLIELCREETREVFRSGAAQREEVSDAFALLLAYGCAIEKLLAQSAGTSGSLPGHNSLRVYVQQLLMGEAPRSSVQRLQDYFTDAFQRFAATHLGVEKALQSFADNLVERFKPSRIEARVKTGGLAKLFGGPERACWEEYCKEFHSLDAMGMRKLGEDSGLDWVRIGIPRHEGRAKLMNELRQFCDERHINLGSLR